MGKKIAGAVGRQVATKVAARVGTRVATQIASRIAMAAAGPIAGERRKKRGARRLTGRQEPPWEASPSRWA